MNNTVTMRRLQQGLAVIVATALVAVASYWALEIRADLLGVPNSVTEVQALIPERYQITVTDITLLSSSATEREYLLETMDRPVYVHLQQQDDGWRLDWLERMRR